MSETTLTGQLYQVEIEVFAQDKPQAGKKIEALLKIADSLSHDDLVNTAEFIQQNPQSVKMIKDWIIDPPVWLKSVGKAMGVK